MIALVFPLSVIVFFAVVMLVQTVRHRRMCRAVLDRSKARHEQMKREALLAGRKIVNLNGEIVTLNDQCESC